MGVAYRGGIPLERISSQFGLEPGGPAGFTIEEKVELGGDISEEQRVRLERAVRFCPVGQALTKGSMNITDEIHWSSGEVHVASAPPDDLSHLAGNLPGVEPGGIDAFYDTKAMEYDADGKMVHEGAVRIFFKPRRESPLTGINPGEEGKLLMGAGSIGHSGNFWVKPPFVTLQAAWIASTLTTLYWLLPVAEKDRESLRVEAGVSSPGGRDRAQGNAAAGTVSHRNAVRRIFVPGSPDETPLRTIQAALLRDPLSIAYREGGVLLREEVIAEK